MKKILVVLLFALNLHAQVQLGKGVLVGAASATTGGVWSSTTTYTPGSVVTYSGQTYLALLSSTNAQPDTNPLSWSVISSGGSSPVGPSFSLPSFNVGTGGTRGLGAVNLSTDSAGNDLSVPGKVAASSMNVTQTNCNLYANFNGFNSCYIGSNNATIGGQTITSNLFQITGPGRNSGPITGTQNNRGWRTNLANFTTAYAMSRGIAEMYGDNGNGFNCQKFGDCTYLSLYHNFDPGIGAPSDEGNVGIRLFMREYGAFVPGKFMTFTAPTLTHTLGVVTPTGTFPSTAYQVVLTINATSGPAHLTDGSHLMYDPQIAGQSSAACSFAGPPVPWAGIPGMYKVPITGCTGTVPALTAWGTATGTTDGTLIGDEPGNGPPTTHNVPVAQSFVVTPGTGSGAFGVPDGTNSPANFGCLWNGITPPENARFTGYIAGTHTVTANVRLAHTGTVAVLQGPSCAPYQIISFDVDINGGHEPSSYLSFGSPDGGASIVVADAANMFRDGDTPETSTGANAAFHLVNATELTATLNTNAFSQMLANVEDNGFLPSSSVVMIQPHGPISSDGIKIGGLSSQFSNSGYKQHSIELGNGGDGVTGGYTFLRITNSTPTSTYRTFGGGWASEPGLFESFGVFGSFISNDRMPVKSIISGGNWNTGQTSVDVLSSDKARYYITYNSTTNQAEHNFRGNGGDGVKATYLSWSIANGGAAFQYIGQCPIGNPAQGCIGNTQTANIVAENGSIGVGALNAATSVSTGTPPTACGTATGCMALAEASTAGTPTAGQDYIRADASTHQLLASVNGAGEVPFGGPSVSSINGTSGAFTFSGSGQSCSGTTCTFAGAAAGPLQVPNLFSAVAAGKDVNQFTLIANNVFAGNSFNFSDGTPFVAAGGGYTVNGAYIDDSTLSCIHNVGICPASFLANLLAKFDAGWSATVPTGTTEPLGYPLNVFQNLATTPVYTSSYDAYKHYGTGDGRLMFPQALYAYCKQQGLASSQCSTAYNAYITHIKAGFTNLPRDSSSHLFQVVPGDEWVCNTAFEEQMRNTGLVAQCNVQYAIVAADMAQIATAIGNTSDATFWNTENSNVAAGIRANLIMGTGELKAATINNSTNDDLYATSLAVGCDLLPEVYAPCNILTSAQKTTIENYFNTNYASLVDAHGYVLQTSKAGGWTTIGVIPSTGGPPYSSTQVGGGGLPGPTQYQGGYWSHFNAEFAAALAVVNQTQANTFAQTFLNGTDPGCEQYNQGSATCTGATPNTESPQWAVAYNRLHPVPLTYTSGSASVNQYGAITTAGASGGLSNPFTIGSAPQVFKGSTTSEVMDIWNTNTAGPSAINFDDPATGSGYGGIGFAGASFGGPSELVNKIYMNGGGAGGRSICLISLVSRGSCDIGIDTAGAVTVPVSLSVAGSPACTTATGCGPLGVLGTPVVAGDSLSGTSFATTGWIVSDRTFTLIFTPTSTITTDTAFAHIVFGKAWVDGSGAAVYPMCSATPRLAPSSAAGNIWLNTQQAVLGTNTGGIIFQSGSLTLTSGTTYGWMVQCTGIKEQ